MANHCVRLSLYSGTHYSGRRIRIQRGGIAIRDLRALRFNNELSSFQLINAVQPAEATLVLFSACNFQGSHRVFRGCRNIADLGAFNFNNVTSSLIVVGRRLSDQEIEAIQTTKKLPKDLVVIRQ